MNTQRQLFGQQKVVDAMENALEEGKQLDEELTQLAESEVNPAMLNGGEESQENSSSKKVGDKKK